VSSHVTPSTLPAVFTRTLVHPLLPPFKKGVIKVGLTTGLIIL